ncbi:hypothetical protein P9869_12255 [Streptomyces ossamyceticus]|nr:hypothetical protein [Streptomyces ossamyceticus]
MRGAFGGADAGEAIGGRRVIGVLGTAAVREAPGVREVLAVRDVLAVRGAPGLRGAPCGVDVVRGAVGPRVGPCALGVSSAPGVSGALGLVRSRRGADPLMISQSSGVS